MILATNGKNYATYEEWSGLGFHVQKGQKSGMVDENSFEPLFGQDQVARSSSSHGPDHYTGPNGRRAEVRTYPCRSTVFEEEETPRAPGRSYSSADDIPF